MHCLPPPPTKGRCGLCRDGKVPGPAMSGRMESLTVAMKRNMSIAFYILAMIALIVGVDFLFFKDRFWERLMVNIGVVMVFAAFYFRFFKHG